MPPPVLRLGDEPADRGGMKNLFFQLGAAFAALVMLFVFALEVENVGESIGLLEDAEPVLVFTIPNPRNLARVRAAIDDKRIVGESDEGFSVVGGRVYVKDLAQAGGLISKGGWVEKPIQIVSLGVGGKSMADAEALEAGPTREERMVQLRRLVKKPALNRTEQVFVLQAMNDGLEI